MPRPLTDNELLYNIHADLGDLEAYLYIAARGKEDEFSETIKVLLTPIRADIRTLVRRSMHGEDI